MRAAGSGSGTGRGARAGARAATVAASVLLTLLVAGGGAWKLGWLRPPAAGGGGGVPAGSVLFYRNPMNPAITSQVPAKDEMGMDYIPVYAGEGGRPAPAKTPEEEAEDFFAEASPEPVPGLAPVEIGGRGALLSGVQTARAESGTVHRTVRTVGRVVPDETAVRHVHTKVGGWIERLHVNFSGQLVDRGRPLLDLYSPEILTTEEELLEARRSLERLGPGADPGLREGAAAIVAAARRRLELFDVPADVVAEVERLGRARRAVTIPAPVGGYVTGKGIFEGQQVEPGTELYTVTDLARVWVEAELYEREARFARLGQEAVLALPFDPGERLAGRVTFVAPVLDPASRTLAVRLEFPNPGLALKPGMFADVSFTLESAAGVTIPDSAVIDSGARQVVFVGLGEARFEPRLVRLGVRGEGRAQVLEGVAEGERVVVRANFLIDSESRLRALIEQAAAAAAP